MRSDPPLAARKADPLLQLVELAIMLGDLGDRQLGIVGRAGRRIAQECLAQSGNLVEIELIGVPGLRDSACPSTRPAAALERGLDLGPSAPGSTPSLA